MLMDDTEPSARPTRPTLRKSRGSRELASDDERTSGICEGTGGFSWGIVGYHLSYLPSYNIHRMSGFISVWRLGCGLLGWEVFNGNSRRLG
jgi:hypothetical protein